MRTITSLASAAGGLGAVLLTTTAAFATTEVWFASDILATGYGLSCSATQTHANNVAKLIKERRASEDPILLTTEANNCYDYEGAYDLFNTQFINQSEIGEWYAVPGNHAYYSQSGSDNHQANAFHKAMPRMQVPQGERTHHTVQLSPSWVLLGLDSELDDDTTFSMQQQNQELQEDLEYYSEVPCQLAYFHRPAFSNAKGHADQRLDSSLVDTLISNRVELMLSGHEHAYERLAETEANQGTVQVVAGTGGSRLDSHGFFEPGDPAYVTAGAEHENVYGAVQLYLTDAHDDIPPRYYMYFWGYTKSDPEIKIYDFYWGACRERPQQ